MTGTMTWVGLDVHARSTHAAAIDTMTGELSRVRFGAGIDESVAWLLGLPGPVRACYEAGPTGFGSYRAAVAIALPHHATSTATSASIPAADSPGSAASSTATSQSKARRPPATSSAKAAHATMRSPGPLRAFGQRVRKRRNNKIATVAVARKLACLAWQLLTTQQDYIYERPALTHRKLRQLELAAGAPKRANPRGSRGPATPDVPAQWKREREDAERVEEHYRAFVDDWQPQRPRSKVT